MISLIDFIDSCLNFVSDIISHHCLKTLLMKLAGCAVTDIQSWANNPN